MFGNLGGPELIFILAIALLIFGPKRLPEIGRMVGKGMAEFRRASNELKRTLNAELEVDQGALDAQRSLWQQPPASPLRPVAQTTARGQLATPPASEAAAELPAPVAPAEGSEALAAAPQATLAEDPTAVPVEATSSKPATPTVAS